MISTKTMIKDDFANGGSLEYSEENCTIETPRGRRSGTESSSELKEEFETSNDTAENENKSSDEIATTSGNNLFTAQIFAGQRNRQIREAKALETSIANLKRKLQRQGQSSNLPVFTSSSSTTKGSDSNTKQIFSQLLRDYDSQRCTIKKLQSGANGESALEAEEYSGNSSSDEGPTAVERSLAAMSKASNSNFSTSSRTSLNGIEDDDGDDDESKSDAFLDKIFGSTGTDNSDTKNVDNSESRERSKTPESPPGDYGNDKALAAAMRRKRQRRNPVWPYFIVVDGTATCKHCNYSTKSVFSTNLKVHLRTHHHDLFEEVIKAEEEQQEQVVMQNSLLACPGTPSAMSAVATAAPTTPFMHRVTTTALPAFGNSTISNSSKTNLATSAAALLSILNQTNSFQNATSAHTTTTTPSTTSPTNGVNLFRPVVKCGSIADLTKSTAGSKSLPDLLKPIPDFAKTLPEFLKAMSETSSIYSTTGLSQNSMPVNTTKPIFATGNAMPETTKSLSKASQKTPPQLPLSQYGSGEVESKNTLSTVNQSPVVLKRRRLRRHPVWRFFKDIGGDGSKTVKCVNCSFSTSSPFSTNLKMHLKAHHKSDYRLILVLESRQRLEEGISPIPDPIPTPNALKRNCSDDTDLGTRDLADEQPYVKKRSISSAGIFEDDGFVSMTNTERIKAMIDLAAASQTPPLNFQEALENDDLTNSDTSETPSAPTDEASSSVDTSLLARLGLSKPDSLPSSSLNLNKKFPSPHTGGSAIRSQLMSGPQLPVALDTTKSVRTVSKRLPTGEVVKVRTTRKCVENPITRLFSPPLTATADDSSTAPVATATINDTKPILSFQDLKATTSDAVGEQSSKFAKHAALAKFLVKADAFHLLGMPEFKQFVETLDSTYQLPSSSFLKRLVGSSPDEYGLSAKQLQDFLDDEVMQDDVVLEK